MTAEKYVAGVYTLIGPTLFFWVHIRSAKLARLRRRLERLSLRLGERAAPQS